MKRKGPPYKVIFCKSGEEPPSYVSHIRDGEILISGSNANLSQYGYSKKIKFKNIGLMINNRELIDILLRLNKDGLAFSYDYKSGLSPSGFMKELQDIGELRRSFKEISWKNPDMWYLTTYEME